jgi:hypothetical protein
MPETFTKVFLSSTVEDLKSHREAVRRVIDRLGYRCVNMESFGSRPDTPAEVCREEVRGCDIFVGIVGTLYGSSPPDSELSFTELEYEAAAEFGKRRLMFVAAEDISLPHNLREPDDKKNRQDAFRQRVRAQLAADLFRTPDELATLVSAAITNLERKGADGRGQARAVRRKPAPNGSGNVSRMCDRAKQEADFVTCLGLSSRYRPGFPLACMVHGEESENHQSFVERLRDTKIQQHAGAHPGRRRGSVKHVPLKSDEWPYDYDRASRRRLLKSYVCGKLAPRYSALVEEYSVADLRRLLGQSLNSVFVFEHKIMARLWDGETADLLRWYLEFWDEVKGDAEIPQCFIFFKLVYPDARRGGLWGVWRKVRRANPFGAYARARRAALRLSRLPERAVDPRALREPEPAKRAAASHCAFALLDELTCVGKEHVMEWLGEHLGLDDEGQIEQRAVRILTDARGRFRKCRDMRAVESSLYILHRQRSSDAVRA